MKRLKIQSANLTIKGIRELKIDMTDSNLLSKTFYYEESPLLSQP
jgi:hypothetical protein